MKIVKWFLFISIFTIILYVIFFYLKTTPTFLDRPTNLSEKLETIEVTYVNWACDCPDFIETKYHKNNLNYETKEEDCIFIEPLDSSLKIPNSFYRKNHFHKKLLLTGQFYKNKGIPNTYEQKTPEKPNSAKVFRYTKFEIVNLDE